MMDASPNLSLPRSFCLMSVCLMDIEGESCPAWLGRGLEIIGGWFEQVRLGYAN